jgi:hypothetical protein
VVRGGRPALHGQHNNARSHFLFPILPGVLTDVDRREERREGTVSVFNGPVPVISLFDTTDAEAQAVAEFIKLALADGIKPDRRVHASGTAARPRKRRNIPFVVVSAYPRPLVRTEPGQEILQKPVKRDLLCDRVEAACKVAA